MVARSESVVAGREIPFVIGHSQGNRLLRRKFRTVAGRRRASAIGDIQLVLGKGLAKRKHRAQGEVSQCQKRFE
jgi:hypothetical protein